LKRQINDRVEGRVFESVHDAHCCKTHGCKYGDDDCPVVKGKEKGIPCEMCYHMDATEEKASDLVEEISILTKLFWNALREIYLSDPENFRAKLKEITNAEADERKI
jgi:hypothetical protein